MIENKNMLVPLSHYRKWLIPFQDEKTRKFIIKARLVHGNKYDYSKSKYIDYYSKVCIICPKHGEFWQTFDSHLQGQGCRECKKEKIGDLKRGSNQSFIEKAKNIHGNKYDYSKVNYRTNKIKVCIICPDHGEFWQKPNGHLLGYGCPMCANIKKSESKLKNTETFIKESSVIHNNKYDYSKTNYVGRSNPVCIICPEHGEFWQRPGDHLNGSGCPTCGQRNLCESYVGEWLSNNNIEHIHLYPISGLIRNSRCIIADYWIKINDKILMAEYNGDYHYKFNKYMHRDSVDNFKNQLMRDEKLRLYCKKNSITLIEIPYTYNTRISIFAFLDKVILQGIDPNTLVDYESLFERPSDYIPYTEGDENENLT